MSLFAWAGAVLFFGSLAFFLFSYVVVFGRPAADGPAIGPVAWNVALFSVFALHHSVFARTPVRSWIARVWPAALERALYVWVASLLFIVVIALWMPVPGVLWSVDGPARWALWAVQAAGVWLTLHSAAVLDVRELAGIPASPPSPTEFRTGGPYGWVRHPIYLGWFLLVWAASPMTMTRAVFAAVSCAYLVVAIPLEEGTIRRTSLGAYDRYAARVRWRLLPGIW